MQYLHYGLSFLLTMGVCAIIYWDVMRLISAGAMTTKQRKSLIPVFKLIGCYTGMGVSIRYMIWALGGTSAVALVCAMVLLVIPFTLLLSTRFIKTFGTSVVVIYPIVQLGVLGFLRLMGVL